MSSDNFYVVRPEPSTGRFVLSMGFASDETPPCKLPRNPRDLEFDSEALALSAGIDAYSEYGVSTETWCLGLPGHHPACRTALFPEHAGPDTSFD